MNQDEHRQERVNEILKYSKAVEKLIEASILAVSFLAVRFYKNTTRRFTFQLNTGAEAQVRKILERLTNDILNVINSGTQSEWLMSSKYNDGLVKRIFKDSGLTEEQLSQFMNRNLEALKAFQNRKIGGLKLSEKVWNITQNFQSEMELALSVAIGEGKPAVKLAQEVQRLLKNPDMLFHRVRNQWGQLVLSKHAQNYHPGAGVYRSSFQNALRLARSEINMAYRRADYERWQELPFIIGFEVELSNAHKIVDICNDLKGRYPKNFLFVGWHPSCLCHCLPILCTQGDFDQMTDQILAGKEIKTPLSASRIKSPPQNFHSWIEQHKEKAKDWSSMPYFIRDNFKNGAISKGLRAF